MSKKNFINIFMLVLFLLVSLFLIFGCGKKANPRSLKKIIPKPVTDLSYRIENNVIHLTWTIPDNKKLKVDRFIIYRAIIKFEGDDCINCPLSFKKAANISPDKSFYIESLQKGFRYVFKIIVVDDDDITSKDSNVVDVNYLLSP